MHISPAIRRRVIWGAIIGVFLIVIIVAILTYADSYALTEGAKRCAPEFWKSKWPLYLGCAMAAHEGLAGGLLAGAGALWAAWLAFQAVQEQLGEERELRRTQQREAKEAAVICIAQPVHAAAAALSAIETALRAKPNEWEDADKFVDLGVTFTRATLESFTVREGIQGLDVDDKALYLAIVATLAAFVNVSTNPSPTMLRQQRLENHRDLLMKLHRYLRPFDSELADVFVRDSGTAAHVA